MAPKPPPALGSPVVRYFNLLLSNGASLRLPITGTQQPKTVTAAQDIFSHSRWAHKIKTEASIEKEKNILPDMTDFYAKFNARGAAGRGAAGKGPRK